MVYLHRFIMQTPKGVLTDHIDGNPLNNQKGNLRFASPSGNARNQRKSLRRTSSRYKGVSLNSQSGNWNAYINVNSVKRSLGTFSSEADAAKAYDKSAIELHGQFANLNFPAADYTNYCPNPIPRIGRKASDEARQKMREAKAKRRIRLGLPPKPDMSSEATFLRRSAARKAMWEKPGMKKRVSEIIRKQWSDDSRRTSISSKAKAFWSDPLKRAERIRQIRIGRGLPVGDS